MGFEQLIEKVHQAEDALEARERSGWRLTLALRSGPQVR